MIPFSPSPGLRSVMVSNAVRLHAHRIAFALQRIDLPQSFHTTLWQKLDTVLARAGKMLPGKLARMFGNFFDKRTHPALRTDIVVTHPVAEIRATGARRRVARRTAFMAPASSKAGI